MPRHSGGGGAGRSAGGGNRRRRGITTARKRKGVKGMSAYEAKQTMPYSQTMPGPLMRIRRTFDGFRKVSEYAEPVPVSSVPAPRNSSARKW